MRILLAIVFILAALKWSNWRKWPEYYPTILFVIGCNFFFEVVTAHHKLWILTNSPFESSNTANSIFDSFTIFAATVLLYLDNFPQKLAYQICYVLLWVSMYTFTEFAMTKLGYFVYDNGWSLTWSIMFNCIMFPIIRIHHNNPILAWLLSGAWAIFIWFIFGFSLKMLG